MTNNEEKKELICPARKMTEAEIAAMQSENYNELKEEIHPIISCDSSSAVEENSKPLLSVVKRMTFTDETKDAARPVKTLLSIVKRTDKIEKSFVLSKEASILEQKKHSCEHAVKQQHSESKVTTSGVLFTPAKYSIDDDIFIEDNGTWCLADGKETLLFYGVLRIKKKIRKLCEVYDAAGTVKKHVPEYAFIVELVLDITSYTEEVTLAELMDGSFILKMSGGETYLEKGATEKKYYQRLIRSKISAHDYITEVVYATPGWKKLANEEGYVYVTPNGVIGKPNLKVFAESGKVFGYIGYNYCGPNIIKDFLEMRKIFSHNSEVPVVMHYYFISSLLKSLLRSVNVDVQFVLALIGETNSKKTTLAKLFFKLYDRYGGVDIDFTATKVALEEAMGENADAVTIFDDITPPNTRTAEHELKTKLEQLTRSYGGNLSRRRSKVFVAANPGASEFTPVLSSAVITGEVFPVALASSRSRILKLELCKSDCNLAELTKQQHRMEVLPTFAETFLAFVQQNQHWLLDEAKAQFDSIRYSNPLNLHVPRFAETFALLQCIQTIWGRFLVASQAFSSDEVTAILASEYAAIVSIIKKNDLEASARPDEVLIAESIINALASQKGNMANDPTRTIFDEGTFLVVYPIRLIEIAKEHFAHLGKIFPYTNVTEFSKFLSAKGLIKSVPEGSKTRYTLKAKPSGIANELRFYFFYQEKIEALSEVGAP